MNRIRPAVIALFGALALLPSSLSAQAAAPPADQAAEANQWLTEIQQIHGRLSELQEKALQDPDLRAQQDSLGSHIRAAMEALDPTLVASLDRIQQMDAEATQAEAQNDEAKLSALSAEAQKLEQQFLSAQQRALAQPELAAEFTAFQTALQAKILAADPQAPQLLARFQELEQKLAAVMGGQ